jgi:hypothetical protein
MTSDIRDRRGTTTMTTPGWAILSAVIYLVLIFTLALMTFRKGHWVLGIIGFIFPLLWLIGAIMPSRRRYR